MIYASDYQSPLGELRLFKSTRGLCGVSFLDNNPLNAGEVTKKSILNPQSIPVGPIEFDTDALAEIKNELDGYFNAKVQEFTVPIDYGEAGTAFQRLVWDALRTIPYGTTISYGELAAKIGNPRAARAVGLANNKNPLAIVIPCHRVIGANGSLVGYAGGLAFKQALLELEGVTLAASTTQRSTFDAVLDAAAKEFAHRGFDGARVDQIAVDAGANKRMIYHHFESKDKLYDTVLNHLHTLELSQEQQLRFWLFHFLRFGDGREYRFGKSSDAGPDSTDKSRIDAGNDDDRYSTLLANLKRLIDQFTEATHPTPNKPRTGLVPNTLKRTDKREVLRVAPVVKPISKKN